jgi:hypothetical protein
LPYEFGGVGKCVGGPPDDRLVVRPALGALGEGTAYGVVVVRSADHRHRRLAQLRTQFGEPLLRRREHLCGGQLGVERVPQPSLPDAPAEPRTRSVDVSCRLGAQPTTKLLERHDRVGGQVGEVGRRSRYVGREPRYAVAHQRSRTGELLGARFDVHLRHVVQHGTRGVERVRDRTQPRGKAREPDLGRRARSFDQRFEQRTWVVYQRIPRIFAHLGELEQVPVHARLEDRMVDLLGDVELVDIGRGECIRGLAEHGDARRHGVRGEVVQTIVEAVIARNHRGTWARREQRIDDAIGERRELRGHTVNLPKQQPAAAKPPRCP